MKWKKFSLIGLRRTLLLVLIALCGATLASANGPKQEFSKKINREFGISATGTTAIYNKYGKVNINTWSNNSVKIDIIIIVNTNDQRAADRTFERIKINFLSTADYVKAETVIESETKTATWLGSTSQDFKINYEVWMPIGNQLDLKNKYGNAFVANLNGKLSAEIKYGDLRTEAINNDADLSIGYGKASMVKVRNLTGYVSYGGLNLTDAASVQIDTKYSNFQIDNADAVRVTSKYDNFDLGNIHDLRVQTKYANLRVQQTKAAFVTAQYTDVKLNNISGSVDADLSYGSLKVGALGRNFSDARVVAKYTDVQMNVESGTTFRFDAEGTHTGLRTPTGAVISRKDKNSSHTAIEGFVGDANSPRLVRARLSYGDFVLKQ